MEAGDVVELKSGNGPSITIAKIDGEKAECMWMNENGELEKEEFPVIVLQTAD